jgi:hypothetical protein
MNNEDLYQFLNLSQKLKQFYSIFLIFVCEIY